MALDKKILITGGGSGGHIAPAKAFIEELRSRHGNALDQILYVGSNLGMAGEKNGKSVEQKFFENTEIPFIAIRGGKLQRSIDVTTFKLFFGIIGGVIDSFKVIKKFKPDIIFSTGGFVTVPVCFVARLKKIPIYIHEQTAAVGLTNKIASKFAKKIFITFPQSAQHFPQGKCIHVGNAVRKSIWETNGEGPAVDALKKMIPNRQKFPIIFVTGGAQGAHKINITIRQMLTYLLTDFQVLIQTGDNNIHKDYDVLMKEKMRLSPKLQDHFHPIKLFNDKEVGFIYKNTDLYIGRSGANFVYEMGLMKKPSIMVPIPWVTHDEQTKNAKILVECGLGKIIPEGELTAAKLHQTIKSFWSDIKTGKLKPDEDLIKKSFTTDAIDKIFKEMNL